jgi:acetyl esterase/lipase
VVAHPDLVYRRAGGRSARLDVYLPADRPPLGGRPAVVVIHGGGWRGGSKSTCRPLASRLAQRGYVVFSVDYLLSRPGHPSWPENLADVRQAVRWVRGHAGDYGVDPARIAALGASAGGHLAALLGTVPAASADGRGAGDSGATVQAVIDFYGPADLVRLHDGPQAPTLALDLLIGAEPAAARRRYEAASPLRHVSPGDPPMLLIHGSDDRLVPPDQSQLLASALERAGVAHRLIVVAGARHGFGFRVGPRDLLPEVLAFLDSVWNQQPLHRFAPDHRSQKGQTTSRTPPREPIRRAGVNENAQNGV